MVNRRFFFYTVMFLLFTEALGLFAQADTSAGKTLSLEETLKQLSVPGGAAELRWDPLFRTGAFSFGGHYVTFATGAPGEPGLILLDGRDILSTPGPYLDQGLLRFPEAFVTALRDVLAPVIQDEIQFRIAAIVVDPGHGGKDPGATGYPTINGKVTQVVEKDITLKISKLLYSRLSSGYPDKRVLLTRQGDTYPSLEERVLLANSVPLREYEAIVFISIHANYNFSKNARGYEVWHLPPDYRRTLLDEEKYADVAEVIPILNAMREEEFTTESILMARFISNQINTRMGRLIPFRGIKAEDWYVVRNAQMPAVLVELGFVSNDEDARILTEDTHLRNYAEALYKGIADFIAAYERNGGFSVIQ